MYSKRISTALLLALLVVLGVFAGCGGGGDEQPKEQQGGTPQKQEGGNGKAATSEVKIAVGTVKNIKPDKRRLILVQSKVGRLSFKVVRRAAVTLDGEKVELADVKKGQDAQVRYVVLNNRKRARSVSVFGEGGATG